MKEALGSPRTLEYHVLRVCERFGFREHEFLAMPHVEQMRLLAYEQIRRAEENASGLAAS